MRAVQKSIFFIAMLVSMRCVLAQNIGIPFIQNYTKQVYQAGNQNWSISKGKNGILYFGNASGLLVFDGNYWENYPMPNQQIVRSVLATNDGKIYVGAFGEIGYWSLIDQKLQYTSLKSYLPHNLDFKDEIWKIYQSKDALIFQSFSAIYIYKNKRFKIISAHAPYLFLHQIGTRLCIESLEDGLFELIGHQLVPLIEPRSTQPKDILSVLEFKDDQWLLGTRNDGLFLYNGKEIVPFQSEINPFLIENHLNNGVRVSDNLYIFGTISNGSIWMDNKGKSLQKISKKTLLQNNTILSLNADNETLWLGLDNGIDRISLHSPISYYTDQQGVFGTVYASALFDNKLYLGTNQGLFYTPQVNEKKYTLSDFTLVKGSEGQVWSLDVIDHQLFCGHNNGTFLVKHSNLEKISSQNGGWVLKNISQSSLIQGTYTGLVIYKKNALGEWYYANKIEGFAEPSRYIEPATDGSFWVSNAYKGLYRIWLDSTLQKVSKIQTFGAKDGLKDVFNINICRFENQILFGTSKGLYQYNGAQFIHQHKLQKSLGSYASSGKLIPESIHRYWVLSKGKVARLELKNDEMNLDSNSLNVLDHRMIQYYENIHELNGKRFLISIDDGFAIYDTRIVKSSTEKLPKVLIRKLESIRNIPHLIGEFLDKKMTLEPSEKDIRINYALPIYVEEKVEFQYYLQGFSQNWSEWNNETSKDFTNLAAGSYTFSVRARVKNQLTEITQFNFSIATPWYVTKWAYTLYCLLSFLILYFLIRYYDQKIKEKHLLQFRLEAEEKEKELKRNAEIAEQKLIKLKAEKLQSELSTKNRELSNTAMTLVYKNELLQKLSDEVEALKNKENDRPISEKVNRIQKVISNAREDEHDWSLFEKSFNEAHEDFFKRLKTKFPDLVPNDLKTCAYLRMNMSSKEMASLLNISVRGIEIKRYRLRKKLHLNSDKNLVEFLIEL